MSIDSAIALDTYKADKTAANSNDSAATASVTKALRILDVFRSDGPVLGVSELARKAGVAKSTAFRLLALLEEADLVEREGRNWKLSWRLFELGSSVQSGRPDALREIASPWLTDLYVKSGQVALLTILDNGEALCIEKVSGPMSTRLPVAVGTRLPANCSAAGKALLAFNRIDVVREAMSAPLVRRTRYSIAEHGRFMQELKRVRQGGVARESEEVALGLVSVAAPVMIGVEVIAAVSVTGPATRFDMAANEAHVRRAAHQMAQQLGSAHGKSGAER